MRRRETIVISERVQSNSKTLLKPFHPFSKRRKQKRKIFNSLHSKLGVTA